MTPLATKLVFFTSSALGALTLGSTAYLVEHPRMFAAPVPVLESVTLSPMRPLPPAPTIIPEVIQLEPMTITGSKQPLIAPRRAVPAEPAKVKEFVPCSDWEEMGPTNVEKGKAIGVRRVRKLC